MKRQDSFISYREHQPVSGHTKSYLDERINAAGEHPPILKNDSMADKTTTDNAESSNGLPFNELDYPSLDYLHTSPATLEDLIKSRSNSLPVSLMTPRH